MQVDSSAVEMHRKQESTRSVQVARTYKVPVHETYSYAYADSCSSIVLVSNDEMLRVTSRMVQHSEQ